MVDSCEHDNKQVGTAKYEEFVDQQRNYKVLKKESGPWSQPMGSKRTSILSAASVWFRVPKTFTSAHAVTVPHTLASNTAELHSGVGGS
jgi:hypothetical protein